MILVLTISGCFLYARPFASLKGILYASFYLLRATSYNFFLLLWFILNCICVLVHLGHSTKMHYLQFVVAKFRNTYFKINSKSTSCILKMISYKKELVKVNLPIKSVGEAQLDKTIRQMATAWRSKVLAHCVGVLCFLLLFFFPHKIQCFKTYHGSLVMSLEMVDGQSVKVPG